MAKAEVSIEHLFRVFTKPESGESTLAKIERDLSDNLSDFLSQNIVARKMSLEDIENDFAQYAIPDSPQFVSEHAEQLLDKLVTHSVNTYSPTFIGHMTSALPYFHLALSKLMVGLNQNLVKIETSKAFTPMERQVVGMLHHLVFGQDEGFYQAHLHSANHALGTFCSGGTLANISALWVARNHLLDGSDGFPPVARVGLQQALNARNLNGLVLICSRRAHYSVAKAADVLGLGRDNIVALDCPDMVLDTKRVEEALIAAKQANKGVLAIIGIAGTTETGHIDPLTELADLASSYDCWLHVDAAWGGATLFSSQYRHLLRGVERADSVTIDAHKHLYVPMGAGLVLYKHPEKANAIRHHAQYILREGSKDLGAMTIEGSRNGMAMLLYSALHIFGKRGYELLIDLSMKRAREFASLIEQDDAFELVTSPILSLLTYRIVVPHFHKAFACADRERQSVLLADLDEIVRSVQKIQRERGKSFVSRTRLEISRYNGSTITVFRVVIANPLTKSEHLAAVLDEQKLIATGLPQWQRLAQTCTTIMTEHSN